ncbi:MAG TPA: HAD family phosphatase [Candidatus Paceibacterota bacterium]|nr:HAD family phosphatase [Candidatus Paceibacterota bacterium]
MAKRTRLAIFDIDGTIFRSSLIIELFNELVRRGVFPGHAHREVERDYLNWLNRKGHYNDYIMRVVRVFYREIAGCSVKRVAPAVRATVTWQKDRVHRFPRELIGQLRRRGYRILAISNSPEPMVRQFARAMGFDGAIGYTLEVRDGIYTGRSIINGRVVPGASWMDKLAVLKRYIAEQNLRVDLRNSTMIGDSEGDLPLLSFVGKPIAFNPSLPLARIARRNGWRIVVERKDAVYDIKRVSFVPVTGIRPHVPYGNKKK